LPDELQDSIDDAMRALGGDEADFIIKGIPGHASTVPHAVGLFCRLCPVPGSEIGQGVESAGMIELWELITDARAHYDEMHGGPS
jgi:hypothetical protein